MSIFARNCSPDLPDAVARHILHDVQVGEGVFLAEKAPVPVLFRLSFVVDIIHKPRVPNGFSASYSLSPLW